MWDEQQHVVDTLPAMHRLWVGIEVAEWRHDSPHTRRQMTDPQCSAAIRRWLAELQVEPAWTFVDPSAASFSNTVDGRAFRGHPARNDVLDGIRTVSTALDAGLLRVHSSCSGLLAELPGYSWDPAASDRGEDRPLKRDDPSCDALRYALHSTVHEWRRTITTPFDPTER